MNKKGIHGLNVVRFNYELWTWNFIDNDVTISSHIFHDIGLNCLVKSHYFILSGFAAVKFSGTETLIEAHQIQGDHTGWLYIGQQQILKAEVIEGQTTELHCVVNLDIGPSAILHVPLTLVLDGVTLNVAGRVTFKNIVVEQDAAVNLLPQSQTVSYSRGTYIPTSSPGTYFLTSVVLKRGAVFHPEGGFSLVVDEMTMKRYVEIEADFVNITGGKLILERGAKFDVSGKAPHGQPGDGLHSNGGSYASEGGVGAGLDLSTASPPYGSVYRPDRYGSASGDGNPGGSYIWLDTVDLFLYGHLIADGNSSDTVGGGSGGSIYVKCQDALYGLGSMEASGGHTGSSAAGAGSGGRIAVFMAENLYQGSMKAAGGDGISQYGSGGPGSIYIEEGTETARNLKETLIVDNFNGQQHHYLTLNESSLHMELKNVEMFNYAKLQLIEDGKNRSVNIQKVHGDGTGLLRLQRHQKGTLERFATGDYASSKLEINLELHDGGEFLLSETTFILGRAPVALDLDGVMRGVLNLIVGEGRKMRVGSNARIVPFQETEISKKANVTFSLLQLDPGSVVEWDPDTGSNMVVGRLNIKFASRMMADYFNISCTDLSLEVASRLSSAGPDRPQSNLDTTLGSGRNGSEGMGGAGHAGKGGESKGNTDVGGEYYGSTYWPVLPGSRGYTDGGGRGGGYVYLAVGNQLYLDGEVTVNGTGDSLGGGSAGSILIQVNRMDGIGQISSCGGNGVGDSGAGSGGRVAVYCNRVNHFLGRYIAYGGTAALPYLTAAAGTVYLEEIRNQLPFRQIRVDNGNRPWDRYSYVHEPDTAVYAYDELHITNQGALKFNTDPGLQAEVDVRLTVGDGTGLLHVQQGQYFNMEYEQTVLKAYTAGLNFIVEEAGEIIFPPTLYIYGTGVVLRDYQEHRSFQLYGRLTGVILLSVAEGNVLYYGRQGHTAAWSNNTYVHIDKPGQFSVARLDLKSYSMLKYTPDTPLICDTGSIDVRYKAVISAENVTIVTGHLNVEAGGKVTAAATDRPEDTLNQAAGQGESSDSELQASGAGHASHGGAVYEFDGTLEHPGGSYYGSLYHPKERGSKGGSSPSKTGGEGGGLMKLTIGFTLHLDGDITVDGAPVEGYAGGGSAGSVHAQMWALEGHGRVLARGGDGYSGGSGGRVALYLGSRNHFEGEYLATGGGCSSGTYLCHGGPGSVFLQDTRNTRPHTQLRLDNAGRNWDQKYTLDEPYTVRYVFDEVHLYNNASLQMLSDHTERNLTVNKLLGDRSGRIHLHANHTCFLEKAESAKTTTKTPANIWIDEGSRAFMATLVYILGTGEVAFRWNGEIVGVQHLRIVPGRVVEMGYFAQTSSLLDGQYTQGQPGIFHFSSFELGAGSSFTFPTPMGMHFTVAYMVSQRDIFSGNLLQNTISFCT